MLLILAGVSISLVVGDNGVLTQASNASKDTDVAKAKEAVEQAISSIQADFVTVRATDKTKVFMAYLGTKSTTEGSAYDATISGNISGYTPYYQMPTASGDPATIAVQSSGVGCVEVSGKYYWFKVTGTENKLGATIQWCTTEAAESLQGTDANAATVAAYADEAWK